MLVIFALLLGFGVLGATRMKDGLDMTDVVPRGTVEHETMAVRAKYFGYYNVFIATKASKLGYISLDNSTCLCYNMCTCITILCLFTNSKHLIVIHFVLSILMCFIRIWTTHQCNTNCLNSIEHSRE